MQKDWLSVLVKVKAQVEGLRTDEVLSAYSPLLAAVGMQCSAQTTVSDMLFFLLKDKANSNPLVAMVDTSEFVSPRSGHLDKVGDDCLKVALSYLSLVDRCAAERSCKRLFHLSREFPIVANSLPTQTAVSASDSSALLRIAKRLSPRVYPFGDGYASLFGNDPNADVMKLLCKAVTNATIEYPYDLHFPRLEVLDASTDAFDDTFGPFLQRHCPTLSKLSWELCSIGNSEIENGLLQRVTGAVFRSLSQMPQLRTLELVFDDVDSKDVCLPTDCVFSQIEVLEVDVDYDSADVFSLTCLKPLLHANLRRLQLSENIEGCSVNLASVRCLELDGMRAFQVLAGLSPESVERISLSGDMLDFAQLYAATTHLPAAISFHMSDTFERDPYEAVAKLRSALGSGSGQRSLEVECPFKCATAFVLFTECIGSFVHCIPPLTVKPARALTLALPQISRSAASALQSCVKPAATDAYRIARY